MRAGSIQNNRPPSAELIKNILIYLYVGNFVIINTHDIFVDERFDEDNSLVGECIMFGSFEIPPIEGVQQKEEDSRKDTLKRDNNSADRDK